jgi:hypothetical protein
MFLKICKKNCKIESFLRNMKQSIKNVTTYHKLFGRKQDENLF